MGLGTRHTVNTMGKPLSAMQRNQLLKKAMGALAKGDAKSAFKAAAQVAMYNPADADALIMLSQAAPNAGGIKEALRIFASAMKSNPGNEDTLICWGNLKAAAGDLPGAEGAFRRAVKHAPKSNGAQLNLANTLSQIGKTGEAIGLFEQVVKTGGGWQAQLGLANALMICGELHRAEAALLAVLDAQPQHVGALNNLGRIFLELGNFDRADTYLEKAQGLQPDNPGVLHNLGSLRRRQNRTDEAITLIRRVIELGPENADGYSSLADILEMENRLVEATATVEEGLARLPGHPGLLIQAARLDRRDGRIENAVERLKDVSDIKGDLKNIAARHQELGVLYDKLDDTALAYEHFTKAKQSFGVLSRQLGVGPQHFLNAISSMHGFVKDTDLADLEPLDIDDERKDPCFLIGFLRSGTTLLHQILDTHHDITVIDEKPMAMAAEQILVGGADGYPGGIATLDDPTVRLARDAYFQTLDAYLPENKAGSLIIDKFPFNTVHAPLLWRAFPKAKFIFAVRHPMDVCLSCYMQAFQPSVATSPFLSMSEGVQAYANLMDMWLLFSQKVRMDLLNVRYEDMIADQEGVSRQLFEFVDIPWDDKALNFHEHAQKTTSVSNPSYHQVVKPIYKGAADRWRRYDAQLKEFYPQLQPYLQAFGYDAT
jgi:tetratricopeptide (TPR) repeat protein